MYKRQEEHKTTQNILKTRAFTVSLADRAHMDAADFFGIATGNKMADKFERTGYHAAKSERVNAPIIEEFPVVMECELAEVSQTESFYAIVGKIVNTAAEERVLSENGKVDPKKLDALIFDQFQHGYYAVSYTHLDVYKRQATYSTQRRARRQKTASSP